MRRVSSLINRFGDHIIISATAVIHHAGFKNFHLRRDAVEIKHLLPRTEHGWAAVSAMSKCTCFEKMHSVTELCRIDGLQKFTVAARTRNALRADQWACFIGKVLETVGCFTRGDDIDVTVLINVDAPI